MDDIKVKFGFEKETKNKYRYMQLGSGDEIISTLYITKSAVPHKPPYLNITITDKNPLNNA